MKFYDFSAKKMNGQEVKMEAFKGKVVLVVNTASKCGLTPQFTELEQLNKKYKEVQHLNDVLMQHMFYPSALKRRCLPAFLHHHLM